MAGGLGVEQIEKPIQAISLTERWDERIKETSTKVRACNIRLRDKSNGFGV
jgi:COP9 signalosome complex subunit 4